MEFLEIPQSLQPAIRIAVILAAAISLRVILKILANRVVTKL
jgi:hypothetical protein